MILEENGLLHHEYLSLIDKMVGMRNIIVHSYDRIDDAIVYGVLKKNLNDIKRLSAALAKIVASLSKK